MSYSVTNPPALVSQRIGDGPAIWIYKSADDDATVNGANYFTNGLALGMRAGDIVLVVDTGSSNKVSLCGVAESSADGATTAFGAVA